VTAEPEFFSGCKEFPLYITQGYDFHVIKIHLTRILLCISTDEQRLPKTIAKHIRILNQHWSGDVIYVQESMNSTQRARLIQAKIPFIVPGNQMYVPFLGIVFRERFKRKPRSSKQLSPTALLLILGKIYFKDWIALSPIEMAPYIGCSNMTIGRAFKELQQHGLGLITTHKKSKFFSFSAEGKELWESAYPVLRSPVSSISNYPLKPRGDLIMAGETALSHYTNLAEPAQLIYAVSNRIKTEEILENMTSGIQEEDSIVQKWIYNPRLLTDTQIADPLSVYLSCIDSNDERIEQATEELLGRFTW
jgi:DNA-binding transcriptional regulator YhcF (GntR family)